MWVLRVFFTSFKVWVRSPVSQMGLLYVCWLRIFAGYSVKLPKKQNIQNMLYNVDSLICLLWRHNFASRCMDDVL